MGVSWWLDPPPGQEPTEGRNLPKGTFKAKYSTGSCGICREPVRRNEVVRFTHREGVRQLMHYRCPPRTSEGEARRLFDDLR